MPAVNSELRELLALSSTPGTSPESSGANHDGDSLMTKKSPSGVNCRRACRRSLGPLTVVADQIWGGLDSLQGYLQLVDAAHQVTQKSLAEGRMLVEKPLYDTALEAVWP